MGECLIMRRGGETYKLPVLNPNYPADVTKTVIKGNTTSASFNVSISTPGNPAEYTYQWYVNGSAVSGATGTSYTKSDLSATATYTVYCEVTNKAGTVQSRIATLKVTQYYTPVLNTSYPANSTVVCGTNATFSVSIATAGVPASYTYQWYVNNTAVSGATSSSYTRKTSSDKGTYSVYCKVTNAAGTVQSRTATLTVNKTPVLNTSYPANVSTVEPMASTTLKVTISTAGYPTSYTYQWYVNDSAVSGATSSSYTLPTPIMGTYTAYCKVTNTAGTVTSRTATITGKYQKVTYLQSTGTQYLNPAFKPDATNTFRHKLKFILQTVSDETYLFGVNDSSARYNFYFDSNYIRISIGSSTRQIEFSATANTTYTADLTIAPSTVSMTLNGTSSGSKSCTTKASSYAPFLFARNHSGTANYYSKVKLYYWEIYKNGTLAFNFIPCYRKSDSVAGMFDTVNKVFYTNAGTGTFTVGGNA